MNAAPVLLGISLIAFVLGVLSPGNPAELALSQGGYQPTPEQIAAMEEQMGLNDPYPVQYVRWLGRVLRGDLGTSYASNRPVGEELLRRVTERYPAELVTPGVREGVLRWLEARADADGAVRYPSERRYAWILWDVRDRAPRDYSR